MSDDSESHPAREPAREPVHDGPDEQALSPSTTPDASGDRTLWGRTRQGLGKAAAHVSAVGATAASAALDAKTGAASVVGRAAAAGANVAANAAQSAVAAGGQVAATTGLDKAIAYLDGELDERGVKTAIGAAAGAVVDRLDQVTGKQLVELLEARLRLQDEYNDVLASRLAEALGRIAALEERLRDGHS